eukprot:scaffold53257_cov39-Prasinocladus_malaysianus.AAC.1
MYNGRRSISPLLKAFVHRRDVRQYAASNLTSCAFVTILQNAEAAKAAMGEVEKALRAETAAATERAAEEKAKAEEAVQRAMDGKAKAEEAAQALQAKFEDEFAVAKASAEEDNRVAQEQLAAAEARAQQVVQRTHQLTQRVITAALTVNLCSLSASNGGFS